MGLCRVFQGFFAFIAKNSKSRDFTEFPGGLGVRMYAFAAAAPVPSLVRELRSCNKLLHAASKKKKKKKKERKERDFK